MSRKLTSIELPGVGGSAIADDGHKTVDEMIIQIRQRAEHQIAIHQAILDAADADFRVEVYLGVYCRRKVEILQIGRVRKLS